MGFPTSTNAVCIVSKGGGKTGQKGKEKARKVVKLKNNARISDCVHVNGRLLSRVSLVPNSSGSSFIIKACAYSHVIPVSRMAQLTKKENLFTASMGDLSPVTEIKHR